MPKKETGRKKEFSFHAVCVGWITQNKTQWTPALCLIIRGFYGGKNLRIAKRILATTCFLKWLCRM